MSHRLRVGGAALVALLLASHPAAANNCADARVTINAPPLSVPQQQAFVSKFRTALGRACGWWGGGFGGPYHLKINAERGTALAMIPAWQGRRGEVVFRMRTIRTSTSPITHEIVHVIATNGNRFLAEGLAVHAHDALAGQPAFPNFGRDLHASAGPYAGQADLVALDRIPVPARLRLGDLDVRPAYLVAGSFVRFLIETRGMPRFRDLYARSPLVPGSRNPGTTGRWIDTYGEPLAALTAEWRGTFGR